MHTEVLTAFNIVESWTRYTLELLVQMYVVSPPARLRACAPPCSRRLFRGRYIPTPRQPDILNCLAVRGANLNLQTQTGATLAHIAARDGASGCLKVLCEHEGVRVDVVNQAGNTPVMFAAMTNDLEVRKRSRNE